MKIFNKTLWIIVASVMTVLFIAMIVGGIIADSTKRTINDYFGLTGYRVEYVEEEGVEPIDSEYFKSKFVQKNEDGSVKYVTEENGYKHQMYDDAALHAKNVEVARRVQREGTVLLWNNNNAFPVGENKKVSLFSHSSVDFVYSGNGSGYARNGIKMNAAFANAGITVNPTLWNFYASGAGNIPRADYSAPNEVKWSVLDTDANRNTYANYNDSAIFTISRKAGESGATDSAMDNAATMSGDYFGLDANENNTLKQLVLLKDQGIFKSVIVIINTASGFNFDELKAISGIDACIWVGQPGTEGISEIANMFAGKSIPSGHLVDTFMYDAKSAPAAMNGKFSEYVNETGSKWKDAGFQSSHMVYAENIYVGYKYYETRYEDAVLSQGNASSDAGIRESTGGKWTYSQEVAYPFGYGGPEALFEYSGMTVTKNAEGNYDVKLTVKNVGKHKGSDAVQIYIQKPYTPYDKEHGIEQSAVNLCGYAKTEAIEVGSSAEVTVTVKDDAFKTYDDAVKKTYIVEAGDYYLAAGTDAHNAINNILAKKGKTPANTSGVMDAEGNGNLVEKLTMTEDLKTFSESVTGMKITNQFTQTDWNTYSNKTSSNVTYLSRNDWKGTYPKTYKLAANAEMLADLDWDKPVDENPDHKMPLYEQEHVFKLIDLKGLDYDHEAWDTLLNQTALKDQINMIGTAYHGTDAILSIVKPNEKTDDGPLGIRIEYPTIPGKHAMNFPCIPTLSAAFDDELAYEVGYLMGEDMLHTGRTGIYAPAPNMHRTIWGGRAYEYYSEDPFISGELCREQVIGIQETGNYVNVKHFALNDQESARHGVGMWANEQTIRELYLAAFQPCVEEGNAKGVMSSFTRFGTEWSGACDPLNNKVLRGEWGFDGFVISDCAWRVYMGTVDGLVGGNDCILYEPTDLTQYSMAETNATVALLIREASKRILYVVANSNAMNGLTSNARMYDIWNWWQYAILAVQITLGVLAAASIGMLVMSIVIKKKNTGAVSTAMSNE